MSNEELLEALDFESKQTEPEPEVVEEAVETEQPEVVEDPEVVESVSAEEVVVEPTAEVFDPTPTYMGKYQTAEDMENAFREYQSHSDRQLAEERAKREAYEHMLSSEQQMLQNMQAQEQQVPVEVTSEQIDQGIDSAPIDTFHWTVNNRPDLVPQVIAKAAERHGTGMATELQSTWTNIQMQAQQMQMQQQMQQQYEQIMGPQIIQQSISNGLAAIENHYGEEFDALRPQVAENLANMGRLPSYDPDTIASAVNTAFLQAHRDRALQAASTNQQPRTPTPQETVEGGTPGQAPQPTESDGIKQGILDAFNSNPYR